MFLCNSLPLLLFVFVCTSTRALQHVEENIVKGVYARMQAAESEGRDYMFLPFPYRREVMTALTERYGMTIERCYRYDGCGESWFDVRMSWTPTQRAVDRAVEVLWQEIGVLNETGVAFIEIPRNESLRVHAAEVLEARGNVTTLSTGLFTRAYSHVVVSWDPYFMDAGEHHRQRAQRPFRAPWYSVTGVQERADWLIDWLLSG